MTDDRLRVLVACGVVVAVTAALAAGVPGGPVSWVVVAGPSMEPALEAGDVAVVLRRQRYVEGDVIAFRVPTGEPGAGRLVIHRIVGGSGSEGYVVRGDNRREADSWRPRTDDVVGGLVVGVPRLGLAAAYLRTPAGLALLAALVAGGVCVGMSGVGGGARRPPPGFTRTLPRA